MTRIEKYAVYRKQILNEDYFLSNIDNQSQIVKLYHDKIMDLNPNILINESEQIRDFPTVNQLTFVYQVDPTMFQSLKNYPNLINNDKKQKIVTDITDFIYSYEHNSIISDDHRSISQSWLKQDKNYLRLDNIGRSLKEAQKNLVEFQTLSIQKLKKLMETINTSENSNENIEKYKVTSENIDSSVSYKKIYIGLIWALIILLLLTAIVIIIGGVLYGK